MSASRAAQRDVIEPPPVVNDAPVAAVPEAPDGARSEGPSAKFLELIPRDFARRHLVVSRGTGGEVDAGGDHPAGPTELLAVSDSTSPWAVWNVGVRLGVPVQTISAPAEAIAREIDLAYESRGLEAAAGAEASDAMSAGDGSDAAGGVDRLLAASERDLLSTDGKAAVVRLVDALLFEAIGRRASDVHIQPLADRALVRLRLDGVLVTVRELPAALVRGGLTDAIVSRVKVMGKMDIAERRVPQDGRATVEIGRGRGARSIDLRISTLPTSYGERLVIRLLESGGGAHTLDFASLGMPDDVRERYLARAARTSGIVLVTGPTGSGKTTTLYATLRWIALRLGESAEGAESTEAARPRPRRDAGGLNIVTIEDPIEYELCTAGIAISQSQVNSRKGVTFATGLRHILRQDPDVVMVGEIRDAETARIAIQASLTGHLVFSTLHTNDAASAVVRLVDLGVEAYLAAASLSSVLAQRLVRTLHAACGGAGCEVCLDSGFRGRTGLFELLAVDGHMRDLIGGAAPLSQLRHAAIRGGMRSLLDEGRRLVQRGRTTMDEVARVVNADDEDLATTSAGVVEGPRAPAHLVADGADGRA